ncbi:hypothetical protein Tco_0664109 [Tanacetum coccineum]
MDHYTKKALWIYWIRGDDEVELTNEEFSDNEDEVAEVFRIETNILDFETPMCKTFKEFNYLLQIDSDLLTEDIKGFKTSLAAISTPIPIPSLVPISICLPSASLGVDDGTEVVGDLHFLRDGLEESEEESNDLSKNKYRDDFDVVGEPEKVSNEESEDEPEEDESEVKPGEE